MPKRWEQELDRLNDVKAPSSVRDRVTSDSHDHRNDPTPNRRQRTIAGVVAFAVFALALAFAAKAFGGRTVSPGGAVSNPAVFTFLVKDDAGTGSYPDATLTFEGAVVGGNGASYGWKVGNAAAVVDTFGAEFQLGNWVVLPAGTAIEVAGSAETVTGWLDQPVGDSEPPSHLYELPTSGARIPGDAGRYVLEFTAHWPQGVREFYFPIKVVTGDVGASLTLQATPDPTASLAYRGAAAPVQVGGYCWGNGQSPTCTNGGAGPFATDQYLQIPQRTELNVYPAFEVEKYSLGLAAGDDPVHQTGPVLPFNGRFDEPGSFVLILSASWSQGDVQFFFPVEVVATASVANSPQPTGGTEPRPQTTEPVPTVSPIPSGGSAIAVP
jgi:hypothetical protein